MGSVSQEQAQADKNAVAAVRTFVDKIERCPAAEEVTQFKNKWVKVAWGPPQGIKFDVEKTASLVKPYKGTITFSIPYSGGGQHKTQQEAQQDRNLQLVFLSAVEYTLHISADSNLTLDSKQIKNSLDGTWSPYKPIRPERFCWITVLQ